MAAKRKKRKKTFGAGFILLASILLTGFILVQYADVLGLSAYIPSWEEIYCAVGLRGNSISVEDPQADEVQIHVIDVGQGDSILIRGEQQAVLVDAGDLDAGETVVSYLRNLGIEKLDLIVVTHPHADHIGGMTAVLEAFPVGKIIAPELPDDLIPTSRTYENFLAAAIENNIPAETSQNSDGFSVGPMTFSILSPRPYNDYSSLNNFSTVLRGKMQGGTILLCGDAEKATENMLLESGADLESDVIKIAHHGGDTSSQMEFLEAVSPKAAIISVAEENPYGHPHEEVVARLEEIGTDLFTTANNGTVIIEFSPKGYEIHTERN